MRPEFNSILKSRLDIRPMKTLPGPKVQSAKSYLKKIGIFHSLLGHSDITS